MHPHITEAIAAERAREFQAEAAAAQRTRQLRGSQPARRTWLFMGFVRAHSGPTAAPAARPLRDPRAA